MIGKKIKHLKQLLRLMISNDALSEDFYERTLLERTLDSMLLIGIEYFEPKYKPSGKPCYDKPVGVPIIHGETL